MKTYFAEPERYSPIEVNDQIQFVADHNLIKSLMQVVQGFFAVLNDKRQIVALNHSFLDHLNIDHQEDLFGLRLGESVKCIHSSSMEGGCGTSEYCRTCGAAISMVTALREKTISEQICSIRIKPDEQEKNIFFKVKSSPITIEGKEFILIFLEDITYQQKMAELEHLFFHDINNKISGIINGCEILKFQGTESSNIVDIIYDLTYQMVREIEFQKNLIKNDIYNLEVEKTHIKLREIYEELNRVFSNHDVTKGKLLDFPDKVEKLTFISDMSIIIRVLTNMIKNALEASCQKERVIVKHKIDDTSITFSVWNKKPIDPTIAQQLFKRNVSSKKGLGHGFGTYSMKILGEDILGGNIDFETSENFGTIFNFKINI